MKVYTTTNKVFWFDGSEDKPSIEFFENFKNEMIENNNVRVQFINYQNVNVVSKTDDLTYIRVEHNDKEYFYYVMGVTRITNGGFELNLQLDIYTTFTLPFLNKLNTEKIPVQTLRAHLFDGKELFLTDYLLEEIPVNFSEIVKEKIPVPKNEQRVKIDRSSASLQIDCINPVIYFVFSSQTSSSYTFIPVLAKRQVTGLKVGGKEYKYNDFENLTNLARDKEWVSRFMGVFYLPSFSKYIRGTTEVTQGDKTYIALSFIFNNRLDFSDTYLGTYNVGELKYNSTEIGSKLLFNYMRFRYYDNELNTALLLNENNELRINGTSCVFGSNLIMVNPYKLGTINNSTIELPYMLPSVSDEYSKYVAGIYSSVNTNLTIAKQNLNMGLMSNSMNLLSAGLNFGEGDIGGGFRGLFNWAFNNQKRRLQYYQTLMKTSASMTDARRTTSNKIIGTDVESIKFTYYNVEGDYQLESPWDYEVVEYGKLTDDTIKLMNNVLYLNGTYAPRFDTFDKFYNIDFNGFRFILLEQDYITNILNTYIENTVPKNVYSDILNDLTGGIRIWNKVPSYK